MNGNSITAQYINRHDFRSVSIWKSRVSMLREYMNVRWFPDISCCRRTQFYRMWSQWSNFAFAKKSQTSQVLEQTQYAIVFFSGVC